MCFPFLLLSECLTFNGNIFYLGPTQIHRPFLTDDLPDYDTSLDVKGNRLLAGYLPRLNKRYQSLFLWTTNLQSPVQNQDKIFIKTLIVSVGCFRYILSITYPGPQSFGLHCKSRDGECSTHWNLLSKFQRLEHMNGYLIPIIIIDRVHLKSLFILLLTSRVPGRTLFVNYLPSINIKLIITNDFGNSLSCKRHLSVPLLHRNLNQSSLLKPSVKGLFQFFLLRKSRQSVWFPEGLNAKE